MVSNMADIKKIKDRLASLLARAQDAGSSESEVAACMARAQKLMEEFGITETDLDSADGVTFRDYEINVPEGRMKHDPIIRMCAAAVGRLTSVTFYINNISPHSGDKAPIMAVGLDADVEYAMWMLKSLRAFMDDQWVTYRDWSLEACTRNELKAERIGFIRGYCATVCRRINDMIRDYKSKVEGGMGTGTDLIVRKNDLVKAELERRDIHLGRGRSMAGRGYGSEHGSHAGAQAGNSASLGRGVGQSHAAIGKA